MKTRSWVNFDHLCWFISENVRDTGNPSPSTKDHCGKNSEESVN